MTPAEFKQDILRRLPLEKEGTRHVFQQNWLYKRLSEAERKVIVDLRAHEKAWEVNATVGERGIQLENDVMRLIKVNIKNVGADAKAEGFPVTLRPRTWLDRWSDSVGSGLSWDAVLLLKRPKELVFEYKFDAAYPIRYRYYPYPDPITTDSQELTIDESFHDLVLERFVDMVATRVKRRIDGADMVAVDAQTEYLRLRKEMRYLNHEDVQVVSLPFSWLN